MENQEARMTHLYRVAMAVMCWMVCVVPANAGLLDTLNNAAKKLNDVSQQRTKPQARTEDPDKPLHLEDYDKTGSCEGKRSATCMDYMEIAGNCMAPLKGYRAKLTADLIEKKLKDGNLSPKKRKDLEEDMLGLREAQKRGSDEPTIAGKANSQRHLSDIDEEDQVCINADFGQFYQKIYNKCMGADHMGTGKRTEMMQQETMTCAQAVAQFREKRKKEDAPMACMARVAGLRYEIMADLMVKKMQTLKLSDGERTDWEADIAAVRKVAAEGGKSMPQSNDPANPMRPMMRLSTPEEMMAINNQYMAQSQAMMAACNNQANAAAPTESRPRGNGLVNHLLSPANKNASKTQNDKVYADLNRGRGGSTNLLAMRRDKGCADQLIGNLAGLTADMLQSKLNAASGLSAQQRAEWEEDIAAWRAAKADGKNSADSPGSDPYRWQDRLTKQERQAINKAHADLTAKIMRACNSKPSGL